MITVYKFSAEWNESSKQYDSTFNKISKEYKDSEIEFKNVDVEESVELATKYSIKFVPITVIEVNDEVIFKRVGILSEELLRDELNKLMISK